MGCRAQTNSQGKTSAAPAAEHSSPVRSLPLPPGLDRAFSCVSSQRLEKVAQTDSRHADAVMIVCSG